MDPDSGGGFPPDPGLTATALAITSSAELINNDQMECTEDLGKPGNILQPPKDKQNRTDTVSRILTNINKDIITKNYISKSNSDNTGDINKDMVNKQTLNEKNSLQDNQKISQKRPVYLYELTDTGPYLVYIENNSLNYTGKLSALKVGEIILNTHQELDKRIKNIDSIGKNRIKVVFKDQRSANTLIQSTILKQHNLEAYTPKFVFYRQGVIKGIDLDYSEESIKERIKQYDMHCKFTVDFVKRMNTKITQPDNTTKIIPTKTILVSFRTQTLPKYITINHVIFPVEVYVQRVMLCNNCFRYGHIGKQCRSTVRCLRCKSNHATQECEETLVPKCFHCSGNHYTNNKSLCPEFKRQLNIKKLMSQTNISYQDASDKTPRNTYASILSHDVNLDVLDSISQKINLPESNTNIPNTSNYYTQTILRPNKRVRADKPNTTLEAHKKIILQESMPLTPGGISGNPRYMSNITHPNLNSQQTSSNTETTQPEDVFNFKIISEIIFFILDIIKQNQSYEIQESDILDLIKSKLISHTTS